MDEMDELLLRRSRGWWGSSRVDPAEATVARACKEMRCRSMSSLSGSGQFIVTLAALIAAVIVVWGVCMRPAFTGSALSWSCLAFVLLLLLAVAVGVIAANDRGDVITGDSIRVIRSSEKGHREPFSGDGCSKAMGVLACVSALAFIGVMISCMCVDYKTQGWGSVAFLVTLVMLAMVVAAAKAPRGPTIVRCVPDEVYNVTIDAMPAFKSSNQCVAARHGGGSGQTETGTDVLPDTFVVNVGLGSPSSDSEITLGSFIVSGSLPQLRQLQCEVCGAGETMRA